MLNMPSVSPVSNLVSRPVLVAEVVRPAAPVVAVQPTTAISKERSRAENKAPDTSTAAADALYSFNGKNKTANARSAANADVARQVQSQSEQVEQPPAEKSEIQKAMEAQIKELLTNVWKASAKAVDFLLQRESAAAATDQPVPGSLQPAALLGKKASSVADSATKNPVVSYTAQGERRAEDSASAGQLLDVLA